jgi:hypothetical protein
LAFPSPVDPIIAGAIPSLVVAADGKIGANGRLGTGGIVTFDPGVGTRAVASGPKEVP